MGSHILTAYSLRAPLSDQRQQPCDNRVCVPYNKCALLIADRLGAGISNCRPGEAGVSRVLEDRAMVLTRSAQPMRTRSKGRAPEETKFTMLPAKRKHRTRHDTVKDPDEAALPSPTKLKRAVSACQTCPICLEEVTDSKLLCLSGCNHTFCKACVKQLVRSSLKDRSYPVSCPTPSCGCTLDPEEDMRPLFITKRDTKDYAALLDMAAVNCIPEKDRFYCPNAVCSALYHLNNNKVPARCKDTKRECHSCQQDFCMRCGVAWHAGFDCAAYQALPAEERSSNADLQVHTMAKEGKWKRCPSCRFFVERSEGCSFMACHCGCKFDYITGQPYENGIGPAHLFAPEWVDDHIAILAAARQAAAAAQQLAQQHLATAAGLDELQAAIAAHHQA